MSRDDVRDVVVRARRKAAFDWPRSRPIGGDPGVSFEEWENDYILDAIAAQYRAMGATHIDLSDWGGVEVVPYAGGYVLLPRPVSPQGGER